MQHQHFGNLIANGVNRIQRRHWLLENHGNVFATYLAHRLIRKLGKVLWLRATGVTVEQYCATGNLSVHVLHQAHNSQ